MPRITSKVFVDLAIWMTGFGLLIGLVFPPFCQVIREGDVLIRYGGEEFLVLLPGAGAEDVFQIGERIRRAVGETWVEEGDQRVAVSVSLGGTTYRDIGTSSPEEMLARADAALYDAKADGRNRLAVA